MVKILTLKKNNDFKKVLSKNKIHTNFFSLYYAKNKISNIGGSVVNVSFVMQKKTGNAVVRNRIKRKLRAIVLKLANKTNIIKKNYTYILFGKTGAYKATSDKIYKELENKLLKIV